jgi:hypothetical protein
MEFHELDFKWKFMSVCGIIFFIITIILVIIIVLIFKTNLLEYVVGPEDEPDISEFDFIFNNKDEKDYKEDSITDASEDDSEDDSITDDSREDEEGVYVEEIEVE